MTNPEFPQQSSTRRTNAVENQLFVLRSSIEQLRKAYNGHDVEWSDVGRCRQLSLSLCQLIRANCFEPLTDRRDFCLFTEEPYYGSGSGSGDGPDDIIEEGSGLSPIDLTPSSKESGGSSTTHTITTGGEPAIHGGAGGTSTKSDADVKPSSGDNDSNNVNKNNINSSNNNNNKGTSGSVGQTTSQMSLRRALLTYFLPIYIAWFGGFVAELL